jgi:hypothetical protein
MTPTPFLHVFDFLPFEEDLALYLNKHGLALPKNNLYQVWLNLACWFWRRRFKKKISAFLLFCYYLPLGKDDHLHLNKVETPPHKDDLCQVWLKLDKWFWRRSRKCKSLQTDGHTIRRTDGQTTDNCRSKQLTWAEAKMYSVGIYREKKPW